MKKLTITEFSKLTDEEQDENIDEMYDNLEQMKIHNKTIRRTKQKWNTKKN